MPGWHPPSQLNVVYEDAELLILSKPAGLVCHPTKGDAYSSLISRVRLYLGSETHPQLINRLDRETSGLTVVARSLSAARELRRIWETRSVEKRYLAIVHGHVSVEQGTIDAPLGPDLNSPVSIKDCVRPDGLPALTQFRTLKRFSRFAQGYGQSPFSLLDVQPRTGRKHQIRIHLAHLGHPIVGDKIYGGDEQVYLAFVESRLTEVQRLRLILSHQALHAAQLHFQWRGAAWNFQAEPEEWFTAFSLSP